MISLANRAALLSSQRAKLSLSFLSESLDQRITFSRPSQAMMYDSTGKLTYAPNNLVLQSQTLNAGPWSPTLCSVTADDTTAPDGTLTADRITVTSAGSAFLVSGSWTIPASSPIITSIYLKKGSGTDWVAISNSGFFVYLNLATGVLGSVGQGTAGTVDAGNGWWRLYWRQTDSNANALRIRPATADGNSTSVNGSYIWAWGIQAEAVTYETTPRTYNATTSAAYYGPRFDYNPATLEARGLLIEESRTNVVLHSRDLTNAAWTSSNVTAAKDQIGIDGVANSASKITATAGNGTCLQAITLASSVRFQTAHVKRITGSGVVQMTTDGGTTWTPVTLTAGWTRVEIPAQTLANPSVGFRIVTSGDAVAVDCVQNENGTFATSYIPTGAIAVTRAADVASMKGVNFSSWYNQTEGTFVVAMTPQVSSAPNPFFYSVTDGTAVNSHRVYGHIGGVVSSTTTASVSQSAHIIGSGYTVGSETRAALAYKVNDFGATINGGTVNTDTAGTPPSTLDRMWIGSFNGGNIFSGHIKSIAYYSTRLANHNLQSLTAAA